MTKNIDDKFVINKKSVKALVKDKGVLKAIEYMNEISGSDLDLYKTLLEKQINKQVRTKGGRREYLEKIAKKYIELKQSYQ